MRDFHIDLIWTKLQIAFTALGGWLGYALGGLDGLITALIALMAIDYITGILCAISDRKVSSAVVFRGICKKVMILLLVGVANIVNVHIVGTGSALRGATACFYLSNEGLSILENAVHLGLPVPEGLREALAQLHGRKEKKKGTEQDGNEGK